MPPDLRPRAEGRLDPFVYEQHPVRVVFGSGVVSSVGTEVERLGATRVLVLTTPQQEADGRRLGERLGPLFAGVFAGAAMHTPTDVTARALDALSAAGADCVVSLGGGSTTGLGKALALRTDVLQVCVPTTYAGSEMTPILGQTEAGRKTTVTDRIVLPETVLYDVDLTMTLPPGLSATSGINAIAHAVEALYARDRNPVTALMAQEGIRSLAGALRTIVRDPSDPAARSAALCGAWLCGCCLGAVGMALHHKLCHTLGGTFDLPHSETHTVVLPHAVAFNAEAAPDAMAAIRRALGSPDAAQGLYDLVAALGAPQSLRALGMPEDGIERAAGLAVEKPYWNPRPVDRPAVRALIARAWAGERPLPLTRAEAAA